MHEGLHSVQSNSTHGSAGSIRGLLELEATKHRFRCTLVTALS